MGIIPMGTANNIARVLGLPLKLEDAMSVIARGKVLNIDAGRVAGTYFLEVETTGIDVAYSISLTFSPQTPFHNS